MEKEQKVKKKTTGRVRGFIGIVISLLLLAGVFVCNSLTSGNKMFSFVTTGNVMDRFDKATAETSRDETVNFISQANTLFATSADQKYTSYTLDYSRILTTQVGGKTYNSAWVDAHVVVDKDYTIYTESVRLAQEDDYGRFAAEYVLVKTGEKANTLWGRVVSADQATGDVSYLSKVDWMQLSSETVADFKTADVIELAKESLAWAAYDTYNVVENVHNFSIEVLGYEEGEGSLQAGLTPTLKIAYGDVDTDGNPFRTQCVWKYSNLNGTKAMVPQSLLDIVGGAA